MEGSGQWVGYRYLIDADGAAVPVPDAMTGFARRGSSWTQAQGLALALTLDRLGYDWTRKAFGGSSTPLTAMLDEALAAD
jgi:hypothetical protein|tara:strand:+ start:70011 stop:70250 length:240 start_codon:yes stop_codon:yes gene_type:complete